MRRSIKFLMGWEHGNDHGVLLSLLGSLKAVAWGAGWLGAPLCLGPAHGSLT